MAHNILIPLGEILHNKFQVALENGVYKLVESKQAEYPITEVSTKGQVKVYSFDEDLDILPFFSNASFVNKCVDYIFLTQRENTVYAFLVELKSRNFQSAYKQFCASEIFVKYVIDMAKSYSSVISNRSINDISTEVRCILITTAKINFKSPTNPRKGVVYKIHEQYGYKSLPLRAGKSINLDVLFD